MCRKRGRRELGRWGENRNLEKEKEKEREKVEVLKLKVGRFGLTGFVWADSVFLLLVVN